LFLNLKLKIFGYPKASNKDEPLAPIVAKILFEKKIAAESGKLLLKK
jgi:hypothetical protein